MQSVYGVALLVNGLSWASQVLAKPMAPDGTVSLSKMLLEIGTSDQGMCFSER